MAARPRCCAASLINCWMGACNESHLPMSSGSKRLMVLLHSCWYGWLRCCDASAFRAACGYISANKWLGGICPSAWTARSHAGGTSDRLDQPSGPCMDATPQLARKTAASTKCSDVQSGWQQVGFEIGAAAWDVQIGFDAFAAGGFSLLPADSQRPVPRFSWFDHSHPRPLSAARLTACGP